MAFGGRQRLVRHGIWAWRRLKQASIDRPTPPRAAAWLNFFGRQGEDTVVEWRAVTTTSADVVSPRVLGTLSSSADVIFFHSSCRSMGLTQLNHPSGKDVIQRTLANRPPPIINQSINKKNDKDMLCALPTSSSTRRRLPHTHQTSVRHTHTQLPRHHHHFL